MGNVSAKSAAPPTTKFDFLLPEIEKPPAELAPAASAASADIFANNPGVMDELPKQCKEVMPMTFDGARFSIQRGLKQRFIVGHTITMPGSNPGTYRFGVTYVGSKLLSPTDATPIALGEIDNSGNLNARIVHQFTERNRSTLLSVIQNSRMEGLQLTHEYRAKDYTLAATIANPDVLDNQVTLVGSYLQSVTSQLALGTELVYQKHPMHTGGQIAMLSLAGRYQTDDNTTWSAKLSTSGANLYYHRKCSDQLQIGVELESDLRKQESVATVGYQIDLPRADLQFRGSVNTDSTIAGTLEKRLTPVFLLALSGCINHKQGQFRAGIGLSIGV